MQAAANDTALTYIRSKNDTVQVAVEMTDQIHALTWGRLWTSTDPHDCPLIAVADPVAWVREQRMAQQVPTRVRLAALRTDWLALAGEVTMGRAA
jgi:hypothetical protein